MACFSFGVVEIGEEKIVLNGMDAMYYRAQQRGDKKLMAILEHRAEVHDGGHCRCDPKPWEK